MRKMIALLMVAGALVLAGTAYAGGIYISDLGQLGNATVDSFTLCGTSTFTSSPGFGYLTCYSYEMAVSGGTLWDYCLQNNSYYPATGSAFLIRSFTVDYTPTGIPVSDFTNVTSDRGWGSNFSGFTLNWNTTEGSAASLNGGDVGQFNVETPQLPYEMELVSSGQDGAAFTGSVCGPAVVPEPVSLVLGFLGLTSVASFRRLRPR